ncbi:MAG: DUF1552 domain-containing protein [Myxococcota bacterium]
MRYSHSRRLFLTGAGGALMALPFLPSLLPKSLRSTAEAQMTVPKRFIALKTYNEIPVNAWWPSNAPGGYATRGRDGTVELTEALAEPTGRHAPQGGGPQPRDNELYYASWAPLRDFQGNGVSDVFGTAFNPYLDKMLLLRGLDLMPNLNHNHGGILGNFGLRTPGVGGVLPGAQINVTIDQVMARSNAVYPTAPAGPRVLHLGSRPNTFSFEPSNPAELLATGRSAITQAQAFVNPRQAFDTVLAGVGGDAPMEEADPSVLLIDRVLEDYQRAINSPNLSAADRMLLDQHVTRLTELGMRLNNQGMTAACSPPGRPPALDTGGEFSVDVGEIRQLWDNMVDVLAATMACDLSRIATLDLAKVVVPSPSGDFGMGDSENPNSSQMNNWHWQAHDWSPSAQRYLADGVVWAAQNVVIRLLEAMENTVQSDGGTLLDHSIVYWNSELSFNHLNYSLPTAMWGSAGGYLNTGRYVDYIDWDRNVRFSQHNGSVIEGVQYNRMMVTLLQAMGVTPEEYEIEAGRGFGETRPVEKGNGFALGYDDGNVGDVLPGIVAT